MLLVLIQSWRFNARFVAALIFTQTPKSNPFCLNYTYMNRSVNDMPGAVDIQSRETGLQLTDCILRTNTVS